MRRSAWLSISLVLAAAASEATPVGLSDDRQGLVAVEFSARIEIVEDDGGWGRLFSIEPGGIALGVFRLDPDSGLVRFGDGTFGQRPPSGGRIIAGTYRTGVGSTTLTVFDDCFFPPSGCDDDGGDAWIVALTGKSPLGVGYSLWLELSTAGNVFDEDTGLPVLPLELDRFENRPFVLLLTDGVRESRFTGRIEALRPAPEPLLYGLLGVALGFVLIFRPKIG